MSEENVELLRRAWDTFVRRDPAGLAYLHPDIEFEIGPELLPDGGVSRGLDGFREAVGRWAGAWGEFRQEPREFIDLGGDEVIVVAQASVRSKDTGLEFERELVYLYRLEGGKIVSIKQARDRAEALRLAGRAAD